MDFEKFAETTAFRQVARTITALSTQDGRIADEFRAIEQGHISSGKIVEIEGDVPVGMKIKLGDFATAISTRIWKTVSRANWRKFEDARAFARSLGLKCTSEWKEYCASGQRPADIPSAPGLAYRNTGWAGWGDWLGTSRHRGSGWLPFKEARAHARDLGFRSRDEWVAYCRSGKKPTNIPANPNSVYAKKGWAGWGDWLGSGAVATQLRRYLPFAEARTFVHSLGLKSEAEWRDYCKSGNKPADIPSNPNVTYSHKGWAGWGDWLGTGRRHGSGWRPFKEARAHARGLGLKSAREWFDYCSSGKKPPDIPSNPSLAYSGKGWAGWGDWLGTGRRRGSGWRPFKEARAHARALGLRSRDEWIAYCRSGKKPADIPPQPDRVYAKKGWAGWGDWLGSGTVATRQRQYLPFAKARAFVHRLGLKSAAEWRDYCKSGNKPADIPSHPYQTYSGKGWMGWGDWLGTGTVSNRLREFRPFAKARAFVHRLGLKSAAEWRDYCKSGN
jgi:3-mercaptopyruvate sulfurtransferase SseA